ncbi:hypothetical protein F441_06700 [Phytophthora nicotianae CJ01A1]|uniref:Uncharacterized protein n=6 Tax=Phytophthora nicotianae TaxID=4792 RepID=W2RCI1_PHYN3|nr:hypothetical protein PPTG_20975 [Phytophthora nicotianae INRA-310]ETI49350.1 hypothetical protein F443_06697 [Phytophthora nicotianae P1569]ETK89348.1 hypothetical protein L915_06569 [Phytophthora nicotianae]ETP19123.1 hypothetical protein F441_06700 [Phytophthora nicotianae CJ01A1]ETP47182.1 hypothetical protein F442_06732 [Phytophthora nicotianae P10297]ETL42679.1 hypothetical protein L916_06508 [Phytophthora nicotianae]
MAAGSFGRAARALGYVCIHACTCESQQRGDTPFTVNFTPRKRFSHLCRCNANEERLLVPASVCIACIARCKCCQGSPQERYYRHIRSVGSHPLALAAKALYRKCL